MMMQAVGQNLKLCFQIEDDNRKAHVKFRKENPIFYEQVWILLIKLPPAQTFFPDS